MSDYFSLTTQQADAANLNPWAFPIRSCKRCSLWEGRIRACPGYFDELPLDILFVGMNPGRDEDQAGRPFVGAAGRKLSELMRRIFGSSENFPAIGLTNAVRCHTPSNRPPSGEEISACERWLRMEIECSEPKVVILLGNIAIQYAFPGKKIGGVHGAARAMNSSVYLASYHPAAILHKRGDPAIEQSILATLERVKCLLL